MLIVPTVRSPSRVIVRGAVVFPRKFATAVGESGTELFDQLLGFPQLPSASTFHCEEKWIVRNGLSSAKNASLESNLTVLAMSSSPWMSQPKFPLASSQC